MSQVKSMGRGTAPSPCLGGAKLRRRRRRRRGERANYQGHQNIGYKINNV